MSGSEPPATVTVLDFKEACAFLRLKPSRLYYLTSTKQIPFLKVGSTLRFFEHDLIAWLNTHHHAAESAGTRFKLTGVAV
jgi:excisionase family DNA binding protein